MSDCSKAAEGRCAEGTGPASFGRPRTLGFDHFLEPFHLGMNGPGDAARADVMWMQCAMEEQHEDERDADGRPIRAPGSIRRG